MNYLTGFHAIEELIKSGKARGPLLVSDAGPRARAIIDMAVAAHIPVNRTGAHELERVARGHRGIALTIDDNAGAVETTVESFIASLEEGQSALAVILDSITDPHNYGAILRSCDQFGVDLVVVAARRAAKDSETVSRTSSGASAWVPVATVPNLVRAAGLLKDAGFWIYGADMAGKKVYEHQFPARTALVMGSEGEGVAKLLRATCDEMVGIPSLGRVDSLNVSVATGVLLYEVVRQKKVGAGKKK